MMARSGKSIPPNQPLRNVSLFGQMKQCATQPFLEAVFTTTAFCIYGLEKEP